MKKTSKWLFWDWSSIFRASLLFIALLLLLAFVFLLPDRNRAQQAKEYTGNTIGTILSIEPAEQISMSETGNKTVVYSYSIRYSFHVKSKTYEVSEQVPNTIRIQKFLNRLETQSKVKVKYDERKPEHSQIIL
ncbi:DUF3592 domain-containing protein [Fluviicola sp.]|uniref:DUF3592 domain-containing protein n=1 Tax=Fluviicola sp. TaxID=1917219 RepID=UPI002639C24E|nr:DUF3592 domain-containing protein [Fluviicola sp.]